MTISHYWIPLIVCFILWIFKSLDDGEFVIFGAPGFNSAWDWWLGIAETIAAILYIVWGIEWLIKNVHIS